MKRNLGAMSATMIVVANIIGAGIFTTSGFMAGQLPSPGWVLLCWFLGGLIAISGALCYTELATRMPDEGGEYVYLKKLYHPLFGFLSGWTSLFIGFSVPIAASSIAFAEYLFKGLSGNYNIDGSLPHIFYIKIIAVGIIAGFTLLHYLGLRLGAKVQNVLTLLKIGIILSLAIIGITAGSGNWGNITFEMNGSLDWMVFGTVMMIVMFSYSGWNASAYIAGELKRPGKTLPVSLISGTVIVIVLYLLINVFYFYAAPFSELKNSITVAETASVRAFGGWMGGFLSLLISLALLSSISAFVMIGPRIYYAMACDKLFFPYASKVHPKYKVPGRSIIVQGSIAVFMVLIGSFEQLIVYLGFALGIFPLMAVAGIFIARRRGIGNRTAVKVWGYPVTPLFFLVSCSLLMGIAFINRPFESVSAIVTVLLGIPCYYFWVKGLKVSGKKELAPVKIKK
ncbi:APC family permease [candidate division KSB1 bacterium]